MGKVPFNARRSDCLWLNPEMIVLATDKSSPFYDPRVNLPVNEGMVANILYEMQGVLEPILIAKDGNTPTVVDGRQRVKALRKANQILEKQGCTQLLIPCILKRGDSNLLFSMSLSTNEQRVSDTPLQKAQKLVRLLNQGIGRKEAAQIFGVSVATIKRWEDLSELSEEAADAVASGEMSASQAASIIKKPRHKQKATNAKPRKKNPRTIAEIRKALGRADLSAVRALRWVLREREDF